MSLTITKLSDTAVSEIPSSMRVLTWNIERGQKVENIIEKLKKEDADVLLLQELDIACGKRSKNLDIPARIAKALNMKFYVFAKEFDEVGINNGQDGIHGNAIMSKYSIKNAWSKTFEVQPINWKIFGRFIRQPRRGGRNFVACTIGNFLFYSVHTENFRGPKGRIKQVEELINDAEIKLEEFGTKVKGIIIGGDMNTIRAGIAKFLPFYFTKNIRDLFKHEPKAFASWMKKRFGVEDPTFGHYTVRHAKGLYKAKLDWLFMKATEEVSKFVRVDDVVGGSREDSDHKYISSSFHLFD